MHLYVCTCACMCEYTQGVLIGHIGIQTCTDLSGEHRGYARICQHKDIHNFVIFYIKSLKLYRSGLISVLTYVYIYCTQGDRTRGMGRVETI